MTGAELPHNILFESDVDRWKDPTSCEGSGKGTEAKLPQNEIGRRERSSLITFYLNQMSIDGRIQHHLKEVGKEQKQNSLRTRLDDGSGAPS